MKYRNGTEEELNEGVRGIVVPWQDGIVFQCLCNERTVYVASPPHKITFDDNGVLTIKDSCGYREKKNLRREANWCHFFLENGEIEMCSDSKCPGSKL